MTPPNIIRHPTLGFYFCIKDGDTVYMHNDGIRTYAVCAGCGDKLVIIGARKDTK